MGAFKEKIQENQKKIILSSLSFLAVLLLLFIMMFFSRVAIRQSQLEALVYPQITSERLLPLAYNRENEQIKQDGPLSVLFVNPSNQKAKSLLDIVKKQEAELNRFIYIYPLIYDAEQIGKKYQLNPKEATFIFFESGEEKNRFTFEELENPTKELIPEWNRLPMWNMKVIEVDETTDETKDSN